MNSISATHTAHKAKRFVSIGLLPLLLLVFTTVALAGLDDAQRGDTQAPTLVEVVRAATARFKDVQAAEAAGYRLALGCVSGPQAGAMGIHFVNGALVGDGVLDPRRPEALMYEVSNGHLQLLGVEYIVTAASWDANHEAPPELLGQLFHYVGSPNRYRDPAFYELHVWAWKRNPSGTFADWNPTVVCDAYTAADASHAARH